MIHSDGRAAPAAQPPLSNGRGQPIPCVMRVLFGLQAAVTLMRVPAAAPCGLGLLQSYATVQAATPCPCGLPYVSSGRSNTMTISRVFSGVLAIRASMTWWKVVVVAAVVVVVVAAAVVVVVAVLVVVAPPPSVLHLLLPPPLADLLVRLPPRDEEAPPRLHLRVDGAQPEASADG